MKNLIISELIQLFLLIRVILCDNLALLDGTLRTFQKSGCDQEHVTLSCPRGTSISIELAQYGRTEELDQPVCPISQPPDPPPTIITTTKISVLPTVSSGSPTSTTPINDTEIEEIASRNCTPLYVLQYSILQIVVEGCQKKRHCKFHTQPKTFGNEPCPGIHKFAEVIYKCRPYEFRSKLACENDIVQLVCNPYSRIAIYSASYGRTEYESLQCAQPSGVKEETCLSPYVTETIMEICHGRRKCTVAADSSTFGRPPCRPDSKLYLKVVYTCVPRKVLRDRYNSPLESDENLPTDNDIDHEDADDKSEFYPAPKLQGEIVSKPYNDVLSTAVYSLEPSSKARNEIHKDIDDEETSKTYFLYLIIATSVSVLLCVSILIGFAFAHKYHLLSNGSGSGSRMKKSSTDDSEKTSAEYTADDIAKMDTDIDLKTPLPVPITSAAKIETNFDQMPQTSQQQTSPLPPAPTILTPVNFTMQPPPPTSIASSCMQQSPQAATTMFILPNSLIRGPSSQPHHPSLIGGPNIMISAQINPATGLLRPVAVSAMRHPLHSPRTSPQVQFYDSAMMGAHHIPRTIDSDTLPFYNG